eukprot:TRINITY_DN1763_c0_g1_i4.p1 TRINITY_DN1763_c0_g1~~TRINITY_DN1763_c0_g1_i4.p1  ORF type:complete len:349 (+),score=85.39 TRINITY_DN1763_c0_g1_i4:243-1289(+)
MSNKPIQPPLQQAEGVGAYDGKRHERDVSLWRKRYDVVCKERDSALQDITKVTNVKNKLEILCRELQKQNKSVMDESRKVGEEEAARRQELSSRFHATINDVTVKLEEQGEERLKQLQENETLREKLRAFVEQYEIREQHFGTQLKAKELEGQLLEAKLKQQLELTMQEALKAQSYKEQLIALNKTEQELRAQLSLYAEKFEQFQETLTKSNDVFATFKGEMEKMSKTIRSLEKDNISLKRKTEQSDLALITLAEERNTLKTQLDQSKLQKKKLESLCRALQLERTKLREENEKHKAESYKGGEKIEEAEVIEKEDEKNEEQQNENEETKPTENGIDRISNDETNAVS